MPSATIQVGIPGEIRALLPLHHCEVESIVNQHCSALLGTEHELFNVSVNCQHYTTTVRNTTQLCQLRIL